jgi:hypothetical protein
LPDDSRAVFVIDQPVKLTEGNSVILTDEPLKLNMSAITLHDGVARLAVDDANATNVDVILKTDDSSVSVSADSIDEAIKKINDQIKSLKEKGSSGKEKSQQDALTKIAKQLAEIAKSNKAVGAKGDAKVQTRFVIRSDDLKSSPASPEKKAEIDKARAKVKELSKALAAAHADLAKLEGHSAQTFSFVTPDGHQAHGNTEFKVMALPRVTNENMNVIVRKKVEGDVADAIKTGKAEVLLKKIEPKVAGKVVNIAPKREVQVRAIKVPDGEGDRIQALEKKLDQILEEFARLKKSKAD